MSFMSKLMADAQPKADSLKQSTWTIKNNISDSPIVKATVAIGYKSMVNTVGVAMVLGAPAGRSVRSIFLKAVKPAPVKK